MRRGSVRQQHHGRLFKDQRREPARESLGHGESLRGGRCTFLPSRLASSPLQLTALPSVRLSYRLGRQPNDHDDGLRALHRQLPLSGSRCGRALKHVTLLDRSKRCTV